MTTLGVAWLLGQHWLLFCPSFCSGFVLFWLAYMLLRRLRPGRSDQKRAG